MFLLSIVACTVALDCPSEESWHISETLPSSIQTLLCVCSSFSMIQDTWTPPSIYRWCQALTTRSCVIEWKKSLCAGAGLDPCCTYYWLILSPRTALWDGQGQVWILLFSFNSPPGLAFLLNVGECFKAVGRVVQSNCNFINSH